MGTFNIIIMMGVFNMKHFLTLLLCAVLLSACNAGETAQEEPKKEEAQNNEEQTDEKEQPETEPKEEEVQAPIEQPQYRVNSAHWGVEPIGEAPENVVLLTIDDAPDKYALNMAKTLKEKNAPAIFFVNGHFIDTEEEKDVLKQIHEMGFAIGNHTDSHTQLDTLSQEEQRKEIVSVNDEVEKVIGERPKYFRAPFGVNTDYSKQIVAEEKMLLMNWSYGYDWNKEYMNKAAITDIMVNTPLLKNGSNLLMHDREWTAAGLGDIVEGLREKGFKMLDPKLLETPHNQS